MTLSKVVSQSTSRIFIFPPTIKFSTSQFENPLRKRFCSVTRKARLGAETSDRQSSRLRQSWQPRTYFRTHSRQCRVEDRSTQTPPQIIRDSRSRFMTTVQNNSLIRGDCRAKISCRFSRLHSRTRPFSCFFYFVKH